MNPTKNAKNEWVVVATKKIMMNKKFRFKNDQSIEHNKKDNYKKILCQNVITYGSCIYGQKCLYAHHLSEQKIENIRKLAYDMIKSNNDLHHINIAHNKPLYNVLSSLTNICDNCKENKCTGGYNCKHGACKEEYRICLIDLNKGTCHGRCGKIHLTDKGLVPYCVNLLMGFKTKPLSPPTPVILNDDFFKKTTEFLKENQNNEIEWIDNIHDNNDGDHLDATDDYDQSQQNKLTQSIFSRK